MLTDDELYRRGAATLLASWAEYARGAAGAALHRMPGVAAAVFREGPERGIYNNAVLERGLPAPMRAEAIEAMESAYSAAGVARFAAWVHEGDAAMCRDLESRGYTVDETTRAMGIALDDLRVPRPQVALGPADWSEYLRVLDVPPGLLAGVDQTAFHVLVARLGSASVATAMAFDHAGDCGIYNVTTMPQARRRGLATALTARLLHDARDRGCRTASLQATGMAERVYAAIGFHDLGRILEYVPGRLEGERHRTPGLAAGEQAAAQERAFQGAVAVHAAAAEAGHLARGVQTGERGGVGA
jgi:ribosomal protein S18 acetylase RimI-like enzyme